MLFTICWPRRFMAIKLDWIDFDEHFINRIKCRSSVHCLQTFYTVWPNRHATIVSNPSIKLFSKQANWSKREKRRKKIGCNFNLETFLFVNCTFELLLNGLNFHLDRSKSTIIAFHKYTTKLEIEFGIAARCAHISWQYTFSALDLADSHEPSIWPIYRRSSREIEHQHKIYARTQNCFNKMAIFTGPYSAHCNREREKKKLFSNRTIHFIR